MRGEVNMKLVSLTVESAPQHDWYLDTARINKLDRPSGVDKGKVHIISVVGPKPVARHKPVRLFVRGIDEQGKITLDLVTRERLGGLKEDVEYEFCIQPGSPFDSFIWAWNSSDPAYQIATRIAALSFALGVLSLLISLPTFISGCAAVQNFYHDRLLGKTEQTRRMRLHRLHHRVDRSEPVRELLISNVEIGAVCCSFDQARRQR
jgi:hypothetical protein